MTARDAFRFLIEVPWIVFLFYWIIGSLRTRATREKEPIASRLAVLLLEVVGYLLIFAGAAGVGFLETRVVSRTMPGAILGVVLTWLGIGLAIWGPVSPGGVLERPGHNQGRPSAHPHRAIHSPAPPDLLGTHFGHPGFSHCDRRVAMRLRLLPGPGWLLFQGTEGRSHARPAIRSVIRPAQRTHGFPAPAFPLKPDLG